MRRNSKWKYLRIGAAALFFGAMSAAFAGTGGVLLRLPHLQVAPAILKCLAAFSLGALATVAVIGLVTLFFGRVYCAVWCPLGILQDAAGFLSRRRCRTMPNYAKTRYAVAGVAFGLLAAGWSAGFLLLDPYSNFGRIASFTFGGVMVLAIVAALAVWRRRIYCTAICPVGTLLGLIARFSVFKLAIGSQCVRCGKCATVCPAGCIDAFAGTIDNERCVRCMNCVAACPLGGIGIAKPFSAGGVPVDASRRAFLLCGGALLTGLAAGAVVARTGMSKLAAFVGVGGILPPGAGNPDRFAAKCTACQICTANCPSGIIVPAPGGAGPVSVDLSRGACRYDCARCSQVCPTGALRPLSLEAKRRTRIAGAEFNPRHCIVFQESVPCGRCAGACPTGAVTLRKNGAPRPVNAALCIGCGACQAVCPAPVKAMTVHAIGEQVML
ncbi:MAG: 4Fe-4S binding protein [Victivallaceae bacterium]|nr:4Fe-4S binding protein [Victivallaceae bacterium]